MRALPRPAQGYICLVVVAALGIAAQAPGASLDWLTLAILAVLLFAGESGSTLAHRESVRVSAGFAVSLASVVLVGPLGAALVGAAGFLVYLRDGLPPVKRVFNGAVYMICGFCAGSVYQALARAAGSALDASDFPRVLLPFAAATVTHALCNLLLVLGVLRLTGDSRALRPWRGAFPAWTLPYLGYGSLGLIVAALWTALGPLSVLPALLPLYVARWAFRQYDAERAAYGATIAALCKAVETKDYYTRGHCARVARVSVLIARELGMRESRVTTLHHAGMMHDVGKLGVPTQVLQKDGSLTDEEFAAIRLHPTRGVEMIRDVEFLDEARAGIVHHHERLDGRGYPSGLAGMDIPEFARVIAVADAFDSMTSTRSYRRARSPQAAIAELRRHAGTQFDPTMVAALVHAVDRHGWQPYEPAPPTDLPAGHVGFDHDDPSGPFSLADGDRT